MKPDAEDWPLHAALAERLMALQPAPARATALRRSFLGRVRRSALVHRPYQTIRHEQGDWLSAGPGVLCRGLRSDARTRVELQRLAPGATLAWADDAWAQEILLLDGALSANGQALAPTGLAGARGYGVRQRAGAHPQLVATAHSTVYLRQLLVAPTQLPPLEAHWWQLACAASGWVDPGSRRWYPNAEGVQVMPLRGDQQVVSMLVRFEPGASVPDHAHALDEDCLVLQGEMFLGDILLRTGDYQLAPAGGSHFGETSDVGVLFFFHGAIDPVLLAAPAAAPQPGGRPG